jgi:integrase
MASKRKTGRRSRRGGGSVFWDESRGSYVGLLSLGRDPDNPKKRIRKKVYGATERECQEKLDALRHEIRRTGIIARRDTTVEMAVREFLTHPPAEWRSPITMKVYRNYAETIIEAIGPTRLAQLSAGRVDAMLRDMARRGCSKRTIEGTRSLLVRAIRRAERDNLVARNVAALSEMPAAPQRTSKAMTLEQVGALLALEDLTPWWRALITTGVTLGLRPGELLGLRWEDVDTDSGLLRVRQALKRGTGGGRQALTGGALKTEASRRTLLMPAPARAALAALRREQAADRLRLGVHYTDSGLVFCDSAGRAVWPQAANDRFKTLCEKAGLGRDWQLRELRHTFVSQMSQAGVDLEVIADHVGHTNSNITRAVYRHQLADVIGTAAQVFDPLYGKTS